jgi:hypothetical protein
MCPDEKRFVNNGQLASTFFFSFFGLILFVSEEETTL